MFPEHVERSTDKLEVGKSSQFKSIPLWPLPKGGEEYGYSEFDGWRTSVADPTMPGLWRINTDQLTTQVMIPAIRISHTVDAPPIDEQQTWILPARRIPDKASKSGVRSLEVGSHLSKVSELVKSSGLYALSSLASPLVSLVLAPLLTHDLSRLEYGALAVLNIVIALMAGITQLGLGSAFFRAYNYDYESKSDRLGVLSTVTVLLSLVSIPVAAVMVLAAPWLTHILLGNSSFTNEVRLAGIVVLLQNLTVPGFAWLRAESRAFFFSILSIANLVTSLSATIVLVGVFSMGISGSLIATGLGYAVVIACVLPFILLRAGIRIRVDIAKGLLSFGMPNVANFISVWILQLSDRYLLGHLGSLSQTASYDVAYKLGGIIGVVIIGPFLLAWPASAFMIAKREDAARVFQLVFRWLSMVLLFATFAFSLAGKAALDMFFPFSYQAVSPVIPIVGVSTMFYGIYNVFGIGVGIRRKTWFVVIFTTAAAIVNIGLNIFLIPSYGAIGAGVSTLIAYIVLAAICYIVNQRIYPVPFEIGVFLIALLLGATLYIASDYLGSGLGTYGGWGISVCALVLYGGCLTPLCFASYRRLLPNKSRKAYGVRDIGGLLS